MSKQRKTDRKNRDPQSAEDMRLDPELRLCSKFDSTSIAKFRLASRDDMGVRVVDNCAEEHMM